MADPVIPATVDASLAVAPQDAILASPVVAQAPAEAVPAVAPAGAEPVVAAPAAPAEPERTPTLLEKFDTDAKAAEAKAAEAKAAEKPGEPAKPTDAKPEAKPEAAKPADAAAPAVADAPKVEPAAPAAPEPVDYKYTLPDTLKMDEGLKGAVHKAFDEFRTNPTEGAQKLVDLHAQIMSDFVKTNAEETLRNQFKVFNDTKADWEKQWLADPEIGGAGHQTAMNAIARVRDIGISSAKPGTPRYEQDRAEFDRFLAVTGAGSHPVFGRMLHNLARFVDEPQHSSLPANIKPPPSNGRAPGNRRGVIYDHPSSRVQS